MTYDIIIIGAGIAGLTAAIYAARAGKSTLIIEEKAAGGQIITAHKIENWPGFDSISGAELMQKIYHQVNNFSVNFVYDRVTGVEGDGPFLVQGAEDSYQGRALILAVGSTDKTLDLPREAELIGHGISYCATCDGALYQGRDVAVVGGGNTALYDALYLSNLARKVYLIHRRPEFRADATLVDKVKALPNVEIITGAHPCELLGDQQIIGLKIAYSDDSSEPTSSAPSTADSAPQKTPREFSVDAIFVAVGRVPATSVFAGLVQLDPTGYIVAGEDCVTSHPGIFVAGDCRTKSVRQLVTAAADGATAATAAINFLQSTAN